jgi:hypothetical protein
MTACPEDPTGDGAGCERGTIEVCGDGRVAGRRHPAERRSCVTRIEAPAIVATLNAALMKSLDDPDVRKRVATEGGTVLSNSPEQFAAAYRAELAKYERTIKAAGLKVQ